MLDSSNSLKGKMKKITEYWSVWKWRKWKNREGHRRGKGMQRHTRKKLTANKNLPINLEAKMGQNDVYLSFLYFINADL